MVSESLGKVLSSTLRFLVEQGRQGVEWSASEGRHQLEKRQLQKDRQAMWAKLGREVCALVEGGEVQHPGLLRGAERICEIEERIKALGLEKLT
jgi:hypothetical protein